MTQKSKKFLEIVSLNSVIEEAKSGFASGKKDPEGIIQIRMNNVCTDGRLDLSEFLRVPKVQKNLEKYHLSFGDILFNSTNSPNLVGKSALFKGYPEPIVFSNHFLRLRVNRNKIDSRYLARWLTEQWRQKTFEGMCTQWVNQAAVRKEDLLQLQIPLPPLPEQQRIAAILDKADALREKRRRTIAKLDELQRSVFLEMFGDPVSNPKGWEKDKMGNLMVIRRGGSPRPIEQFLGGSINWIKISDATKGNQIYLEDCKDKIIEEGLKKTVYLKSGSLIFANCGVSLGFARILKIDGCIHDGWLSFENIPKNRLEKIFLLKTLNSITEHFRRIAPSGTQPNLNTGIMKFFEIILPPITLQKHFVNVVETLEKLRDRLGTSSNKLETLFLSLQQRAFCGELFTQQANEELNAAANEEKTGQMSLFDLMG